MKLVVRVRPGARTDAVGGRRDGPRGPALIVRVRARAVDGAATAAVLAAVADALGVRRADVRLVSGARGREKVLEVDGDEAAVRARWEALLGSGTWRA